MKEYQSAGLPASGTFIKVNVPTYSDVELNAMLDYYRNTGWLTKSEAPVLPIPRLTAAEYDGAFRAALKTATDGVPTRVADLARAV